MTSTSWFKLFGIGACVVLAAGACTVSSGDDDEDDESPGHLAQQTLDTLALSVPAKYVNGVVFGVAGAIVGDPDTAAHLDGVNDGIGLGDHFDFAGPVSFTVEAWVRPTVLDNVYRRVFSKEDYPGTGRALLERALARSHAALGLAVTEGNRAARLYEALGFRRVLSTYSVDL